MNELSHILKLIDDPDEAVVNAVRLHLEQYDGDLSEEIAGYGITLSKGEKSILSNHLKEGRRRRLLELWQLPITSTRSLNNDWDTFEHLLSLLCDYLHDGITLRPSLADSIDQLADEITLSEASNDAEALAQYLFAEGRFRGNTTHYYDEVNSDLVWGIHHSLGNPISLTLIYMLVGYRCDLEIYGCNYPGHFLAWIPNIEGTVLIDTFNRGRVLNPKTIMEENPGLSPSAREALQSPCTFEMILIRILNNLNAIFQKKNKKEDIEVIETLRKSIVQSMNV